MIKELFLTIVLGALLGFGVTGGYFALKQQSKNSATTNPTPTITINKTSDTISSTPTSTLTSQTSKITIDTPENESIVSNSKIEIIGTTSPNSYLIINTPVKSYSFKSDASGKFTSEIDLESGVNIIQISAIDTDDNQVDETLTVTYSTAKI